MRMIGTIENFANMMAKMIYNDESFTEFSLAEDVSFPITDLSPDNTCFSTWYSLYRLEDLERKLGTDNKLFAFGYNGNSAVQLINVYQDDSIETIKQSIQEAIEKCFFRKPLKQDLFYMTDEIY